MKPRRYTSAGWPRQSSQWPMRIVAKSCPHCGGTDLRLRSWPDSQSIGRGWTVLCNGAGCYHQAALGQWNRRPGFWRRVMPGAFSMVFRVSD
jgi:hypothetical protein